MIIARDTSKLTSALHPLSQVDVDYYLEGPTLSHIIRVWERKRESVF